MRKFLLIGLTVVFVLAANLQVLAGTADLKTYQQKQKTVKSQLSDVVAKKKDIDQKKKSLETEQQEIINLQNAENKEYNELLLEVNQLEQDLLKLEEAIAVAEEDYLLQQEAFRTRLRVMLDNSDCSMLQSLIESESLTDFFERIEIYSAMSRKDKQASDDLKAAKEDVEYKKQLREEAKQATEAQISVKEERIRSLTASRSELDQQIRQSKDELNRLNNLEDQLLKESKSLENEINNLTSSSTKYLGSGKLGWPCPGNNKVVSKFGNRLHPILKKYKMHTGIDIDAGMNADIVASEKGKVIVAQTKSGYGKTVVIDHGGGVTTLYAHCNKILVKVGQEVQKGQKIAAVGRTGLATGPHLHFEVRINGTPKDPLNVKIN